MTPEEFKRHLAAMTERSQQFIDHEAPHIAAGIAVSDFKQNFRRESFDGVEWQEVKRRDDKSSAYKYAARHHPARTSRKILTGDTGDLGRSIEIKSVEQGRATIWTSPQAFGSKEPYGAVHNEGLKAGRGAGFTMPRRQFIGDTDELRRKTIDALRKGLDRLIK